MKRALLIVGAGGHGRVVADAAQQQGVWDRIAFLDDAPDAPSEVLGLPVLGNALHASHLLGEFSDLLVAVGNAAKRLALLESLSGLGYNIPVIRHPSAVVSSHAVIQPGTVLFANSAVNAGARLGSGCIINTCASVDHDCVLGDGVHVSPGAHLAGGVRVGRESWIGIGACVRELMVIGERVMVGAGSAVVTNVASDMTVGGVPAAPIGSSRS